MKLRVLLIAFALSAATLPAQLPQQCAPYGAQCLYSPATGRFAASTLDVSYTDIARLTRALRVEVRLPVTNQPGSAAYPVVIWSQGGEANTDAPNALKTWSETTAAAGYLTITIAHSPRDESQKAALCKALEVSTELCAVADPADWDRANDLLRVVSTLETYNQSGPAEIRGRIDLARVAVAGHAEGSSAALSLAGAARILRPSATRANPDTFTSTRPLAFIAISPTGPDSEGFFDTATSQPSHSWINIRKPILTITGAGDNNCVFRSACLSGSMSSTRTIGYRLMPAGDKYSMLFSSVDLDHEFYGSLDTGVCADAGVEPADCAKHAAWLRATVLAFLDAKVRNIAAAATWLDNGLIRAASANTVLWRKK